MEISPYVTGFRGLLGVALLHQINSESKNYDVPANALQARITDVAEFGVLTVPSSNCCCENVDRVKKKMFHGWTSSHYEILALFRSYLFVRASFAQKRLGGRPDTGVVKVWARCVLCVAWRAFKVFFPREWIQRFPRFLCEAFFVFLCFFLVFGIFAHTYHVENSTACHNSGIPVQGQV